VRCVLTAALGNSPDQVCWCRMPGQGLGPAEISAARFLRGTLRAGSAARAQGSNWTVAKLGPARTRARRGPDWPALELAGAVHPNSAI
jgi:hypothetical protein